MRTWSEPLVKVAMALHLIWCAGTLVASWFDARQPMLTRWVHTGAAVLFSILAAIVIVLVTLGFTPHPCSSSVGSCRLLTTIARRAPVITWCVVSLICVIFATVGYLVYCGSLGRDLVPRNEPESLPWAFWLIVKYHRLFAGLAIAWFGVDILCLLLALQAER